jgi:AraC-like DNA-binding protein
MNTPRGIQRYNIDLTGRFADIAYRLEDKEPQNIGYHYHEGYEVIQIWSGKGCLLVEDRIFPMQEGCIYIINALVSHCTNPDPGVPYTRSKITFSATYIHSLLEQMGQLQLLEPFVSKGKGFCSFISPDTHMREEFDRLFKKIALESCTRKDAYEALINAYLVEMLSMIYRWYLKSENSSNTRVNAVNKHINHIMDRINSNLFEDMSIDALSSGLHLSKYYLCHLFKSTTGLTITQYVIERRVSEAKKLLTSSDEAISEIAMITGFKSFSAFSRTFKRITGYTPAGYRKRFSAIRV